MATEIKFSEVKTIIENYIGMPLATDMFWGSKEIFVPHKDKRTTHFRLFRNMARKSTRIKPHKKDNGNVLTNEDVKPAIWHLTTIHEMPLGSYKVIPG